MSDKTEAQRLADALQDLLILGGVHTDAAGQQAEQMLRRWPDAGDPVARVTVPSGVTPGRVDELTVLRPLAAGEHLLYTAPPAKPDGKPVAHQYLFDGYNGPVWRNDSGPWNGMQPKASRPLYTAPPAERVAALEAENANLRTVMVAAAEEIHRHWDAHCDAEGYGPANLMRRLEEGIAAQYGYTAGAFEEQRERIAALEREVEALRTELRHAPKKHYVAVVTDCEACMTADACAIRGQCAHYLRTVDDGSKT